MAVSKTSDFPETVVQQRNQPKGPKYLWHITTGKLRVQANDCQKTGETLPQHHAVLKKIQFTLFHAEIH